jgi:hypothetical protein
MKNDDIRNLRNRAKQLGIKYITSYTKKNLVEEITKEENRVAMEQLQEMMTGIKNERLTAPVIINVRVPKDKPYKLNIIPQ